MYPFLRMAAVMATARLQPPLGIDDTHVSRHTAMPWDIDVFGEVNNGRMLSLYDLGRFALATRAGLIPALRRHGWALTIAGSSIRYRRRLLAFHRFTMRSRAIGRDDRFIYISQSMWRNGEALSHGLFRTAVVGADGIVPTAAVASALGAPDWHPTLPAYAANWIAAEATRPWPPEK